MRTTFIVLTTLLIILQVSLTSIWVFTDALETFTRILSSSFYRNGIPEWSEKAFSYGKWWYLPALICGMLMGISLYTKASNIFIFFIGLIAASSLLAMIYAMYPIHLMPSL